VRPGHVREHNPQAFAISYQGIVIGQCARQEHFTAFTTHNLSADDKIPADRAHSTIVDVHICGSSDLPEIRQATNEIIK